MIPVRIVWEPVICECSTCICQTQIAYRKQEDNNFTIPDSPINPTQQMEYTISIDAGVYYQVRLRFIGPKCKQKDTFISLYYPEEQCCPTGFTLNPDGTYCYKIEDVDAIITGTPQTLIAQHAAAYSTCGSYIYNTGYSVNGTGASTQITTANSFWVNGAGSCIDSSTTNGPLNRVGVWSNPPMDNQDIGFGVCLNLPESKTYYIGIGADNLSIVKLDGNVIIQQNPIALGTQYGVGPSATFKVWHIYPLVITAGPHILELSAHNDSVPAALGCEVYNATASELISATSYAALDNKLIFSSKDYIGQEVQLGTNGAGYTCPSGYSIAPCEDPVKCRKITSTDVGLCS